MTHLLMEVAALSRFQAEHILRIGLIKHSPNTLDGWFDAFRGIGAAEINEHDIAWEERTGRPSGLARIKDALANKLSNISREIFDREIQTWIVRTYANSLGIALLRLAGSIGLSGSRHRISH